MKIKYTTLRSKLTYTERLNQEAETFIHHIEEQLGANLEFTELEDYDCDLKLIFIETGGSEGLFLKYKNKLKEPYYLLTSGGNNSLAASIEILTYLKLKNLKGEILHGSPLYIAERIKELSLLEHTKRELQNTVLGVIGAPSDWLIASIPDYELLKKRTGIRLMDIPLKLLETKAKLPHFSSLQVENLKKEDRRAVDIYDALKELVTEYHLSGLTLRCFDLLTSLRMTGCLALAYLNQQGIIGTCEGDVMTMVSMTILKSLTGMSSFQANPSRIDVENNQIVFAHCTVPLDMVSSYQLDTHFESGIGVAVKGELLEKEVTIFRMSANLKDYFLARGKIISNLSEENLCRTQICIQLDEDVRELLNSPCGNHHCIVYGDYKNIVKKFLESI